MFVGVCPITAETADELRTFAQRRGLIFPLYRDPQGEVTARFGLISTFGGSNQVIEVRGFTAPAPVVIPPVPTLSTWGLVAAALLVLAAGLPLFGQGRIRRR